MCRSMVRLPGFVVAVFLSYCNADPSRAEQRGDIPAAIPKDDRRGQLAKRETVDELDEISGQNRAAGTSRRTGFRRHMRIHPARRSRRLQETPAEKYYDLAWSDLPPEVQSAYETLLTTEEIWCGESDENPIEDYDWDELDDEMRAQAEFLGYTEKIWCEDEETGEWTCTVDTPAPSTKPSPSPTGEPVSESPVSESPVSESPVSESPVSESPVSESPVSSAPVSLAPVVSSDAPSAVSDLPAETSTGEAGSTAEEASAEESTAEEVLEDEGGTDGGEVVEEECSSIYELASSDAAFGTLNQVIGAAGLGPALKLPGTFTVFAPLNSAFEKILTPEFMDKYLDPVWKPQLQDLVLYHLLGLEVYSSNLSDGLEAPTVNFAKETIVVNLDPPRVNDNSIIQLPDIEACNGVVHGVSEVLLPASVTSDIVDLGAASEDFSALVVAVEAAGLIDTLKGEGPFTLFAPTNDAFAALPEGTVEALLLPENRDMLVSILTYHVVPANALSNSLESGSVTTVNGDAVDVDVSDGGITVNDASVIQANVIASNGIVHVIDAVLLPPEEPEASQATESPTTEVPATEAPVTEVPVTEAPVTEVTETEAPITEAPVTEAPVTEAPEDEHEVEPVPPPPATTEVPWPGADAMLGKSSKSKGGKAKCYKAKSWMVGLSGDDDGECAGHIAKVSKEYAAGKSVKTKQAKAHYDIDAKAEKITGSKGAKIFTASKGAKKTLMATPTMPAAHTDDAGSR